MAIALDDNGYYDTQTRERIFRGDDGQYYVRPSYEGGVNTPYKSDSVAYTPSADQSGAYYQYINNAPGQTEGVELTPDFPGGKAGYTAYWMPSQKSGFDNKDDVRQWLATSGALKTDGTPIGTPGYDSWYYVPNSSMQGAPILNDSNPHQSEAWVGDLIRSGAIGGLLAGTGYGLMSGLGGAGAAAAAGEAGAGALGAEAIGGAALGGGIGGGTGVAGLGLGTGVAGLGLGTSAVGSSLFTAAELASLFPGAAAGMIGAGALGSAGAAAATPSWAGTISELAADGLGGIPVDYSAGAAAAGTGGNVSTLSDLYNYTTGGLSGPTASGIPLDVASGMFGPTESGLSLAEALGSETTAGALSGAGGSSVLDLIKQYGQPAAKALGLTNADGSINWGKIASGGLSAAGGLFTANAATDAAKTQSDAIIRAAQIAADAAKFKPVGVTTRFGQSQFGYDANGNLTSAGYNLSPEMKAQQDSLMGLSNNYLTQYGGAQAATAPMGQAAQTMMGLGNSYLATTPEQQAQKYMQEQQELLSAPRETDMAALQARLQATGRGGLAIGGGASGALAANPELNAYYNSIRQQDLGLAAQATQGGMDYAKFGAGMVGSGGDLMNSMFDTQTAAYQPYNTALGGAKQIEGLGQNAMDFGINIGAKGTAAAANSGNMMAQGITNAAQTMAPANAYSPWGAMLSGAGNAVSQYANPQQSYKFDPFTGRAL